MRTNNNSLGNSLSPLIFNFANIRLSISDLPLPDRSAAVHPYKQQPLTQENLDTYRPSPLPQRLNLCSVYSPILSSQASSVQVGHLILLLPLYSSIQQDTL
jgi:hypothetical protein